MRWRRLVVFAAIVTAHVLVVWLFPSGHAPQGPADEEISFAALVVTEPINEQTRQPVRAAHNMQRLRISPPQAGGAAASEPDKVPLPRTAPVFIDWAKEAQITADEHVKSDADAARRAGALTQWKSHVMPSPTVPAAPTFSWDYAATHRLESSAQGLIINLNDRCLLLISLSIMAVIGGCKLGEIPARGDLFMHMRDDPAANAPAH
jgi:hypothetical protein